MATQHNFRIKNGLEVAGVQRISSAGVITGTLDSNTTATTQSALDNSTKIATTAYTDAAITAVIGGAPGTLDTLNELAAAINDDASYASTLTTALAGKLPLSGGTLTGALTGTKVALSTGSTTDYVLRLEDAGVAAYDVTFPDTGTYQLATNTTSNKTFKLTNAGSGQFGMETEGTIFSNSSREMSYEWQRTGIGKKWSLGSDGNGTYFYNNTDSVLPIYIKNAGNVGIGDTNPAYTLEVKKTVNSNWISRIYNTGTTDGSGLLVRSDTAASQATAVLGVYADGEYRMIVRSNGRMGIGTVSPSSELHVNRTNADSKILIQSTGSGNDAKLSFLTHANGRTIYVDDSDTNKLHISTGHGEANVRDTVFDNDGRVGIRQTDIADTLHISSVDDAQHLKFRTENGQIPRIAAFSGTSAGGAQQMDVAASRVRFETGSTYGGKSVIDSRGRYTGKVMEMINVGSDDWSDSCYYNDPAGGSVFGYGSGGSLGGYSVNSTNGQAAYWYAGLSFSGYVTWIPNVYMPYSIGQVYGLSCTLWCHHANTAGTAVQYVGCIGYDSNFNFMNHDAIGTYQYNLASSAGYSAQTRYHMDVTLKGWNDNGQSDGNKMDRGTVYIRPMMLINYPWSSSSGGTTPLVVMESFTMGPKHTISDNDSNSGTNY